MKKKKLLIFAMISAIIFGMALIFFLSQRNNESDVIGSLGVDKIEFKSKDINNILVDSSIFKKNKLTMINIWGTFCSPCVSEMPDLQVLYENVKAQDVNVIGIVSDIVDDKTASELTKNALVITEKTKVKYQNVIPDETLKSGILKKIQAVPTTIFVDSNGKIVGKIIEGTRTKEEYQDIINNILNGIK